MQGNLKETLPQWRQSRCKKILEELVAKGNIPEDHFTPRQVYDLNIENEFQRFDYSNQFRPGLNRIRKAFQLGETRASSDENALLMDRKVYPVLPVNENGIRGWEKSDVEKWLRRDIDDEKHKNMTPTELWQSRTEYRLFDLTCFRFHIYQEVCSRTGKSYWMNLDDTIGSN